MAQRSVEVHPKARQEALAQAEWFYERSPLAAAAFEREVAKGLAFLSERPEACPLHLHGSRRFVIERFSYDIVFRLVENTILVIAFASHRRRPGYWSTRGED